MEDVNKNQEMKNSKALLPVLPLLPGLPGLPVLPVQEIARLERGVLGDILEDFPEDEEVAKNSQVKVCEEITEDKKAETEN